MKGVGSVRNQYLATFCVNLLTVSYGFACSWTSPSFPILMSEDTPLASGPITSEDGSWIAAQLCVGGLIGNLLAGWTAERFGRKLTACMAAVPQIMMWLMVILADNVYYLMAVRFFGGFSGGMCFMVVPTFIAEISEDRIRGLLGSTLVLSSNLGILIMYIVGAVFDYGTVPYVLLPVPLIFLVCFWCMPESPFYLMKKNDYVSSERSLRFYRGFNKGSSQQLSEEFHIELVKLKDTFNDDKRQSESDKITWSDLTTRHARKAFLIGICLMALNQYCGCFVMLNYTATIFEESGSSMAPNTAAMIIGTIQMFGSYLSTMLVERAGRKLLLIISSIGIAVGMSIFSAYSYVQLLGYDVSLFDWLPLVCFSWVIFIGSFGVLTVPFVVLAELVPQKIKSFALSFCMNSLWVFAFLAMKYFSPLSEALGMHGILLLFAIFSLAGAIFVAIMVPETKGKSFETIARLMN
ncbi:facilitated trehalose transporter Tret1-2 homolog [Uranotaenia lowii]|uniref:facilitated trehalose transporter Tret1-2 homolog n=1 Tax=Uranotaenia lowii TaxID=190385 RepID=UPI0024783DCB|nr:facilitated trehalose transporter Tret1-2 homolog [Uranotaenia lowii]